ncbi:MAG: cob(I)yrinic acid a,c-diamide adenosyltransferase [Rhodospirillales bacterium]|nr:cob(I)yrinic acid a,c-diamide adenosyltransferase [Rhodospirillales bacterium]
MTDKLTPEELERHHTKMEKKKAAKDKMLSEKEAERGLLIVHTGPGKGKSSAAFGMALRCVGHGFKVGIVQFIKGAWDTAERRVFEGFPDLVIFKAMGEGFTWETQDREKDIAAAGKAWDAAKEMIADPDCRMVILDELNVALRYGYVSLEEVLETVGARDKMKHVVITGRAAHNDLIEAADLVTEMKLVKHPLKSGVKAQPGVEF